MQTPQNPYAMYNDTVAEQAPVDVRAEFIKRTYIHLAGAVLAFVGLEAAIMSMPGVGNLVEGMVTGYNWLFVLGAFLAVSYIAERMAQSAVSLSTQYAGLGLYILAEAVIFAPLIYLARIYEAQLGQSIIGPAALATFVIFGALTAVVFMTRRDFSFLRGALYLGGFIAIGLIVCAVIFGFELGVYFSVAMIAFAALWILYDTSRVVHHYRCDQYVVASLALFASLALLFWYILRIAIYIAASRD